MDTPDGLYVVYALLAQIVIRRPNFKPQLVGAVERDATGLSNILNVPVDGAVSRESAAIENSGINHTGITGLEDLLKKIEVETLVEQNAGLPLRVRDIRKYLSKVTQKLGAPKEWVDLVKRSKPVRDMLAAADKFTLRQIPRTQIQTLPFAFQAETMGSEFELHVVFGQKEYKLDGIIFDGEKTFIGESKLTYKEAFEKGMANFYAKGSANPATSFHFEFLESDVLPQFQKYSELAERFGFDGVVIVTNTEFMWQTFRQATEYMKNVEVFLHEFEAAAAKGAQRATAVGSMGVKRP